MTGRKVPIAFGVFGTRDYQGVREADRRAQREDYALHGCQPIHGARTFTFKLIICKRSLAFDGFPSTQCIESLKIRY